jgi:hypothetical protein
LASSAFFIPLVFIYIVVAETIELLDIMLILAVTITHYSIAMANQAQDHLEDQQEGVRTPTVRLGLAKTLQWSIIMTTVGMVMLILIVGTMYIGTTSSEQSGFGSSGMVIPEILLMFVIIAVIISIGYYTPLKGLKDLYNYSNEPIPIEKRMELIKKRISYASWQASGAIGLAVTLGILFVAGLSSPVIKTGDSVLNQPSETDLDINFLKIANVNINPHVEDQSNSYADVAVRLSLQNIDNPNSLTNVLAFVDAGTANRIFESSYNAVDASGRSNVKINLHGRNESEVWYVVYLMYKGERSSESWTEPSKKDLYLYDAALSKTEGLLSNRLDLTINTFNSKTAKVPGSISLKVEWAPLLIDWVSNNATVNPQHFWDISLNREIIKDLLVEINTIKIYLYYDDQLVDEMQIGY